MILSSLPILSVLPLFFFCLTESSTKVCVKQRDPFYVSPASPTRKVNRQSQKPVVLGIIGVKDKKTLVEKKGALVRFGSKNKIVHVGDALNGYTIVAINNKQIVARTSRGEEVKWII